MLMSENYLITGGAGFIGTNLADHYLSLGKKVVIFDNLSRTGTKNNVAWLRKKHGNRFTLLEGDIRWPDQALFDAVNQSEVVFHLAAQVAVTTSVTDPREDFEVNALGTFNILEAVRKSSSRPAVLYTSTNKVYGKMADLAIEEKSGRYEYRDLRRGVDETRPLDFYSPYGCSKGTGDQYVIDYARIYGLKTVVFRQSCIYGPRQFGVEDQGWLAWFAIRALQRRPVTIYGDGKQVRDALYAADLIRAYDMAIANIDRTSGKAYNIGGGPANTLSLLELIDHLEKKFGYRLEYSFDDWRPGDQLVYVSNIERARADFGWVPEVSVPDGVARLATWVQQNENLFLTPAMIHSHK
jgi:CDP-paratose 2-epimerase